MLGGAFASHHQHNTARWLANQPTNHGSEGRHSRSNRLPLSGAGAAAASYRGVVGSRRPGGTIGGRLLLVFFSAAAGTWVEGCVGAPDTEPAARWGSWEVAASSSGTDMTNAGLRSVPGIELRGDIAAGGAAKSAAGAPTVDLPASSEVPVMDMRGVRVGVGGRVPGASQTGTTVELL